MTTNITKRFVLAIALVAAAAGAQAAGLSHVGARDPYTEGARSVQEPRSPYVDGARNVDPYYDGARFVAGLDQKWPSDAPARNADPYLDGALV